MFINQFPALRPLAGPCNIVDLRFYCMG